MYYPNGSPLRWLLPRKCWFSPSKAEIAFDKRLLMTAGDPFTLQNDDFVTGLFCVCLALDITITKRTGLEFHHTEKSILGGNDNVLRIILQPLGYIQ